MNHVCVICGSPPRVIAQTASPHLRGIHGVLPMVATFRIMPPLKWVSHGPNVGIFLFVVKGQKYMKVVRQTGLFTCIFRQLN